MRFSIKTINFFLIILIVGVAIAVRFWDLAYGWAHPDDFGVAKSIIDARQMGHFGWFAVSKSWTYSPFQYLITPLLLSLDQSYREILFWGRLPSCVFASLGIVLWIFFYRMFDKNAVGELILSLTLLACSWENIIFAKQMNNYALGVTTIILMLIVLVDNFKNPSASWRRIILNSVYLALFSHMQYLVLFLVPAYFGTLFIFHLRKTSAGSGLKPFFTLFFKYIVSGLVYGVLIFPMVYYFILPQPHRGIYPWNQGPNGEFFFTPPVGGMFEKLIYTFKFYLINFFLAFQSNISFLPESHPWLWPVTWILLFLFIVGIVRFGLTRDPLRKYLGLFFILTAVSWVLLIFFQKLTFGPTRHHLILLPLMVILIGEGMDFLVSWRVQRSNHNVAIMASWFILILFLANFKTFLVERRDPFDEKLIAQTLKRYDVDALVTTISTQQVEIMKSVRDHFNYNGPNFILGQKVFGLMTNGPSDYASVAFLSFREPIDAANFDKIRYEINNYIYMTNFLRAKRSLEPLTFMRWPFTFYHEVYRQETFTDAENEFSRRTQNGHNGFYFYVFQR